MNLPDWIDSPAEFLTILTITSVLLGALIWLIKVVSGVQKEMRPNGGSSLKDAIDRIERQQSSMQAEVSQVTDRLYRQHERMFEEIGKVHRRVDEHVQDHITNRV